MSGKSCGKRKRRPGKRGSCGGKRKARRLVLVPLVTAVVLFSAIFVYLQAVIDPNIEDISRMRAEVLVTRTINRALSELFQEQTVEEDLFLLKKDENGKTELVQANSIAINILLTQLALNLQEAFRTMDEEPLQVPLGALMGSKMLSQTGPCADVVIKPVSVISTDFRTEFDSKAINQTKYKIYIVLKCRVKVMAPFSSRAFDTSSKILLAETVILGDVPDSFVQVPKDDILDVTE